MIERALDIVRIADSVQAKLYRMLMIVGIEQQCPLDPLPRARYVAKHDQRVRPAAEAPSCCSDPVRSRLANPASSEPPLTAARLRRPALDSHRQHVARVTIVLDQLEALPVMADGFIDTCAAMIGRAASLLHFPKSGSSRERSSISASASAKSRHARPPREP